MIINDNFLGTAVEGGQPEELAGAELGVAVA